MTIIWKLGIAAVIGAAVSGGTVYSLQAQGKKAYTITENQILNPQLAAAFAGRHAPVQAAAGGRNLRTGGGKIIALEGTAPDRVGIVEWESLEKAQAFFKSKAWTDLAPERDKALKTIRRYVVEER